MALVIAGGTAGNATAQAEADVLPEIPNEIPRHKGNGKPRIRTLADPRKYHDYRRASSYAKPVESSYLLDMWGKRAVVYGMSRTPALLTRAQAVPAFERKDDPAQHRIIREELQAIAADAMDAARTKDRAMRGTALHLLAEQADAGADLTHLDPLTKQAVDTWRRMMDRFVIHGTETFVVHDAYQLAGSYDRLVAPRGVMRGPDGKVRLTPDDRVILDLKTGADARYFGPCYAGQQAGYQGGVPYVHVDDAQMVAGVDGDRDRPDSGRRAWPDGQQPHAGWALIPHIPVEHPEEAGLMWVDLAAGRWSLEVARQLYAARSSADAMFGEAELPEIEDGGGSMTAAALNESFASLAPSVEAELDELLGRLAGAESLGAVNDLFDRHHAVWTDECTEVAKTRITELKGAAA